MILAGDIGGTNARLALFDVQNGQFNLVSATIFPSRRYSSLDKIVTEFVRTSGIRPTEACFGVAGPVTNGRVETSNLPWTIESRRLADELNIKSTTLINDLEATGWGIAALSGEDLVPLNNIAAKTPGNQCIVAAGTGLGEGGLFWDGAAPPRFRHRRRPLRFCSPERLAGRTLPLSARPLRARQLRARSFRPRPGERLRIPARHRQRQSAGLAGRADAEDGPRRRRFRSRHGGQMRHVRRRRSTFSFLSSAPKPETWR